MEADGLMCSERRIPNMSRAVAFCTDWRRRINDVGKPYNELLQFPYISVIDEANNFKFGMQLRFAKAHHQIQLEENVGVALG